MTKAKLQAVELTPELQAELVKSVRGELVMPHAGEFASHFINIIGGVRSLAQMMANEYHSKSCSPQTRSKIVQMVLQTLRYSQDNATAGSADNLGLMNDSDLDHMLMDFLSGVQKQERLNQENVKQGSPGEQNEKAPPTVEKQNPGAA